MRKIIDPQMQLGEFPISEIEFDLRCRDEIPKLLIGLHYIYCTPEIRNEIFDILEKIIPSGTDSNNGRPGMHLWRILVLGTLRLNCNWDYDKLQDIVNNHKTIRQMLGHGIIDEDYMYPLQTLKDNVSLLTVEALNKINQALVKKGHELLGKKKEEILKGRCDSFVVETNVHFPTDINLLFDAIRKVITLVARECAKLEISGWRQSNHNIKRIKRLFRRAQNLKRSDAATDKKKEQKERIIKKAHKAYIGVVEDLLSRIVDTVEILEKNGATQKLILLEIDRFIGHVKRQIDQIRRRVLQGEKIPQEEKFFSVFEEHTEWISKGKAGVPQELGLKVCIIEDNWGFILHHRVMEKITDEKIAVSIIEEAKAMFPELENCSFDKGFYNPENLLKLQKLLSLAIMPKKGKLSEDERERESSEEFIIGKRKHSAVESAINALENHSLDRCPDHGIFGFKKFVSLAVLARNIQILGNIIQQKEKKRHQKEGYMDCSFHKIGIAA